MGPRSGQARGGAGRGGAVEWCREGEGEAVNRPDEDHVERGDVGRLVGELALCEEVADGAVIVRGGRLMRAVPAAERDGLAVAREGEGVQGGPAAGHRPVQGKHRDQQQLSDCSVHRGWRIQARRRSTSTGRLQSQAEFLIGSRSGGRRKVKPLVQDLGDNLPLIYRERRTWSIKLDPIGTASVSSAEVAPAWRTGARKKTPWAK